MTKFGHFSLEIKVDGGAAANELLMQFQADLLNVDVVLQILDTTAFGAAFLAGLGIGLWTSQEMILKTWQEDRTFKRTMDNAGVRNKIDGCTGQFTSLPRLSRFCLTEESPVRKADVEINHASLFKASDLLVMIAPPNRKSARSMSMPEVTDARLGSWLTQRLHNRPALHG